MRKLKTLDSFDDIILQDIFQKNDNENNYYKYLEVNKLLIIILEVFSKTKEYLYTLMIKANKYALPIAYPWISSNTNKLN